jgi:hypothetical protein
MTISDLVPQQSVDDAVSGGNIADAEPRGLETPPEEAPPAQEPVGLEEQPTGEPAYTPDLSFTVRDQQHTMDERLKGAMVSKEVEDHLRDLHTRAYGLDSYKERLASREGEFEDLSQKHNQIDTEYQSLRSNLDRLNEIKERDFMSFQRQWKISDQAIIDRANQILEMRDRPVDEQQRFEQQLQDRLSREQEAVQLRAQQTQSQSAYQELHKLKMEQALNAPEVAKFRADYDKKMGEGAFLNQVNDWGSLQYHNTQRYVEPSVSVSTVFGNLSKIFTPSEAASQMAPEQAQQQPAGAPDIPVKPLPNLGTGSTGSPTRRRFKTMKELRAYADKMQHL